MKRITIIAALCMTALTSSSAYAISEEEADKLFHDLQAKYLICNDANGFDSPACAPLAQDLNKFLAAPRWWIDRLSRAYGHLFGMRVCNDDVRYPMDLTTARKKVAEIEQKLMSIGLNEELRAIATTEEEKKFGGLVRQSLLKATDRQIRLFCETQRLMLEDAYQHVVASPPAEWKRYEKRP